MSLRGYDARAVSIAAAEKDVLTCYFEPCSRLRVRAVHSSSLYCSEVCEIADSTISSLRAEIARLRLNQPWTS